MGCFDSAEVCELVGLYLFSKMFIIIDLDNVGLYGGDGPVVTHNANGPELDRPRKNTILTFKNEVLSITIQTNLTEIDFLDVTFNLSRGKY